MVSLSNVNSVNSARVITYDDFARHYNTGEETYYNDNIFSNENSLEQANVEILQERLNAVEEKQGIFSKGWNSFKELVNVGTSVEKCDAAIEQYKNGEISFEEALEVIDNFDAKQESSLNLFSNIVTGVVAIAAVALAVPTGGASLAATAAAIGVGAGAGAATKAAYKFTDRATNEVDGDALDAKQIAKDALSGAVTGGMAAATMGTGSAGSVTSSVARGAKSGAITGSISGASNYTIDCAFDEEKDFNFKDFAKTTAVSAAVGGTVGGIMGGVNTGLHNRFTDIQEDGTIVGFGGCDLETMLKSANAKDIATNSASSASYKILNDRVRAAAHV